MEVSGASFFPFSSVAPKVYAEIFPCMGGVAEIPFIHGMRIVGFNVNLGIESTLKSLSNPTQVNEA